MRAEQCFLQSNGSEVGENFWKECLRDQARFQLFTTTEAAFFTAAYSIICGVGLLSNGLLIYVLFASLKKRNPGDVFIINLALSNFLLAALYIPFLWLPVNEGDFTHGLFFCKFANALPGSNIFCSTLTIAVMAVDRYYAVVNMNKSQISTRNNYFAILVAGLIWIVALALSLPYLLHYNLLSFRFPLEYALRFNKTEEIILFTTCTLRPQSCVDSGLNAEDEKRCTEQVELVVSILQAVFLYLVPLLILVVYCVKLTHFLHKADRRRQLRLLGRRKNHPPPPPPITASSGGIIEAGPVKTPARSTRAIKLLFAMAASYALVWMPFEVLSLYIHLRSSHWTEDTVTKVMRVDQAFKLITVLSICINPIIYGFLNKNLNKRLKNMFKRKMHSKL
ncbi:putative G-protein coupled receptor C56G3.1 [Trichinella nativa]|uniref:G-protein coupled receptor C56G3.1 n=4 Tax=Trichinella TaxID=6333 RepID=A0A0V1LQ99_9BILA|nr:putative G-protein coupled receptor C56G3.1 [Trichinella murrelli]KRX67381.1 putative G-protein coupled receptor C56G3.1 [Trichinella sp. T9]KRX79692.1 putative G-protein coupled receptor C56G3.1 [Trichinella sp. T6]KRY16015.1 putative G-protein coupled receptor C56G3.1 [Trichinella patagoniensis]KRY57775.1 putative G-protein coupled receptor C56G3.1 [Trichinella britovi]KRZ61620.1 putative G-protein coupled receptor C56G3.1 [Trichinella nativa]